MRTWDDFAVGQVYDLGTRVVSRDEIVEFARAWDPQAFHLDDEAAARGPFGGLVASGWHQCAVWMRLYVDAILADAASMGSPGVEEIRWLRPLRPGDVVNGRLTILETAPSARRADRGTIVALGELLGEDGEPLLSMRLRAFFGRR